jgi:hypothetical protein
MDCLPPDQAVKTLDTDTDHTITEGYLEAAYEFFAAGQVPQFHLPHSRIWYIKAALREKFPDRLPPTAIEIEDILIGAGLLPKRRLKDGVSLLPRLHQWPPRSFKGQSRKQPS